MDCYFDLKANVLLALGPGPEKSGTDLACLKCVSFEVLQSPDHSVMVCMEDLYVKGQRLHNLHVVSTQKLNFWC